MNLPESYTVQHMGKSVEISFCEAETDFVFLPWTGYQLLASIDGEPAAFLKTVVIEEEDYNKFLNQPIWFKHFEGRFRHTTKYFDEEFQNDEHFNLIINEGHDVINTLVSWKHKSSKRQHSFHHNIEFFKNFKNNIDFLNDFAQDMLGLKQLDFYLFHVNCVVVDFCESYRENDIFYFHYGARQKDRNKIIDFSKYNLESLLIKEAAKFENSRGRPLYQNSVSKIEKEFLESLINQGHAFITEEISGFTKKSKVLSSRQVIDFRENAQEIAQQTFSKQKKMVNALKRHLNRRSKGYDNGIYQKLIEMNLVSKTD